MTLFGGWLSMRGMSAHSLVISFIVAACLASSAEETPKPESRVNLVVNGGYDETSYHERHRRAVTFFYNQVFKKRATVLDGGGPENYYTPSDKNGEYLRDSSGWVKVAPSKYAFDTTAASKSNVE